jgi:hypothetical protein
MSTHKVVAGILVGSMVPSIPLSKDPHQIPVIINAKNFDDVRIIGDVAELMYMAAQRSLRAANLPIRQGDAATGDPDEPMMFEADDQAIIAALITSGMLPCFQLPRRRWSATGYTGKDLQPAAQLLADALTLYELIYRTSCETDEIFRGSG